MKLAVPLLLSLLVSAGAVAVPVTYAFVEGPHPTQTHGTILDNGRVDTITIDADARTVRYDIIIKASGRAPFSFQFQQRPVLFESRIAFWSMAPRATRSSLLFLTNPFGGTEQLVFGQPHSDQTQRIELILERNNPNSLSVFGTWSTRLLPEPGTALLCACGLLGLRYVERRRKV